MNKITHEEFLKVWESHTWLTGKLADWAGYDWSDLDEQYNFIENEVKLKKYVDQLKEELENKTKLLELYKEALETNFEGITLIKLVNKTLRTQIKELENE